MYIVKKIYKTQGASSGKIAIGIIAKNCIEKDQQKHLLNKIKIVAHVYI